jgi:hypothetical protein
VLCLSSEYGLCVYMLFVLCNSLEFIKLAMLLPISLLWFLCYSVSLDHGKMAQRA